MQNVKFDTGIRESDVSVGGSPYTLADNSHFQAVFLGEPRLFMGHVDKGFQPGVFVRSEPGFSRTSVDSTESAQKQDD